MIKDLGVFLDTKLDFHHQVDRVTAKARSVLGMVKRFSRDFDDKRVSLTLYRSLVRPLLEYAPHVWAPFRSTQIARVESVQKQFLLWFLQDRFPRHQYPLPPYTLRLALTKLDSIEHRHRLAITTLALDITKGLIDCEYLVENLQRYEPNERTLRYTPLFRTQLHRTDYGMNEPMNRAALLMNHLARTGPLPMSSRGIFR